MALSRSSSCDIALPGGSPHRHNPAKTSVSILCSHLTHGASLTTNLNPTLPTADIKVSPLGGSSSDAHETAENDIQDWFDHWNQNPTAAIDNNTIEVDPLFFQKETVSLDPGIPYSYKEYRLSPLQSILAHGSSDESDRGVIDDLTIEIQQLKNELKCYKPTRADTLSKDILFEVKAHGLDRKRKRELEAILREFAANPNDSSYVASSPKRIRPSRHICDQICSSGPGHQLHHATSVSASYLQPADSTYALASTGVKSLRASLCHHTISSMESSEEKVENYLRHLPSGSKPLDNTPLFACQDSLGGHIELEEALRSAESVEGCLADSIWSFDSSRESKRKKQRHEGAIVYYGGAAFYTDLSGEPSDMLPTTHSPWSGQGQTGIQQSSDSARYSYRTTSGVFINDESLIDRGQVLHQQSSAMNESTNGQLGSLGDESKRISDIEMDLIWTSDHQYMKHQSLEPCGLGGVYPEDHFKVVVATKRHKHGNLPSTSDSQPRRPDSMEGIIHRLTALLTRPVLVGFQVKPSQDSLPMEVEYLSKRIQLLAPVPLPSPIIFFPEFITDESALGDDVCNSVHPCGAGSLTQPASRTSTSSTSSTTAARTNQVDSPARDSDSTRPSPTAGTHPLQGNCRRLLRE